MKTDIQFLKDLQQELLTQENDGNADPVFWVIRHYYEIPTWEEQAERTDAYLPQCEHSINFEDVNVSNMVDDYDLSQDLVTEFINRIETSGDYELLEWIREHIDEHAYLVPIKEVSEIVPNTFFITKSDAKKYIENNKHNLRKRPHTYAMTALRSPTVDKLWKVLENFDWDSV